MGKGSSTTKRIWFLLGMLFAGGAFSLLYLMATGNGTEAFQDICYISWLAVLGSNKSNEMTLLYLLLFSGILVYSLFYWMTERKKPAQPCEAVGSNPALEWVVCLLVLAASALLVSGNIHPLSVGALLLVVLLFFADRKSLLAGVCAYFLNCYAWMGLYRLYTAFGGMVATDTRIIALLGFLSSALCLLFPQREKALLRMGMLSSLFLPFLLLVYLEDTYLQGEQRFTLAVPLRVRLLVWGMVLLFLAGALRRLLKKWKNADSVEELIGTGACIAIMAFNSFGGTGAVMPEDMHHPFENIIGFQQIFELGQKPFAEYVPVSGMYSVFHGAVFSGLGGGLVSNYHLATNLFYFIEIVLVVLLLRWNISGSRMLLISLIFYVYDYDRICFLLPVMLLLASPKLIEKRYLWLPAWFLTSLFQGLYYPVYGAAACLASAPLGIWQLVQYVKSGELKRDLKRPLFWILWGICGICLVLCFGCLLGTLRHILAMASQSRTVDGISRFGQTAAANFFPALQARWPAVRLALYYVLTFMMPVGFSWLAFALAIRAGALHIADGRPKVGKPAAMLSGIGAVIMLAVCSTFTFVRSEFNTILFFNNLYSRNTGVLYAGVVLLAVFVWQKLPGKRLRFLALAALMLVFGVADDAGFFQAGKGTKLAPAYTVPENYMYVENSGVSGLGKGFILPDVYDSIENAYTRFHDSEQENSYLGIFKFAHYYLAELKGDVAMEIGTVVGHSAAQEAADIVRENGTRIGGVDPPYAYYYFYHWLLTSGEYYLEADPSLAPREYLYVPNDGRFTEQEILENNKKYDNTSNVTDLGQSAGSMGLSMASLEQRFTEKTVGWQAVTVDAGARVELERPLYGDDADFLYVEFDGMNKDFEYVLYQRDDIVDPIPQQADGLAALLLEKRYNPGLSVRVSWEDDCGETHFMICAMDQGKLLLPLGGGRHWLLGRHSAITIEAYQDGSRVELPPIKALRFLKLQEIQ